MLPLAWPRRSSPIWNSLQTADAIKRVLSSDGIERHSELDQRVAVYKQGTLLKYPLHWLGWRTSQACRSRLLLTCPSCHEDRTLDLIRTLQEKGEKFADRPTTAAIRPGVVEGASVLTDILVHVRFEQRLADRLLARFRSQGFVDHELSGGCVVQSRGALPSMVLLAPLLLFGHLHEEMAPVVAGWKKTQTLGRPTTECLRPRRQVKGVRARREGN